MREGVGGYSHPRPCLSCHRHVNRHLKEAHLFARIENKLHDKVPQLFGVAVIVYYLSILIII